MKRSAADESESEMSILVEELERSVIDGLRTPVAVGAALLVIYFAAEWQRTGALSPLQLVQFLSVATLAVSLRLTLAHAPRKLLFVGLIAVGPTCALFHYGPMLGAGALLTSAVAAGTFFYGRAGAAAMWTALVVVIAACAALTLNGVLHPTSAPLEPRGWLRVATSTAFAMACCAYLLLKIRAATIAAFANLSSARRERESAELRAQRLDSLGRLAGGIAHELNNALQVIQSGTALIASGEPVDTATRDDVTRAVRAASTTARRLLAFGQSRPEDAGRCNPVDVAQHFAASARRTLPTTTTLVVNAPATSSFDVSMSAAALEEVLSNLVQNAVEATPSGGTVSIEVARRNDGEAAIEVGDNGPGVDEASLSHLFEPFFSTKPRRNGLGLAAAWGIVARAGGRIAYASSTSGDGKPSGARFEIRLPALAPHAAATPARTLPAFAAQDAPVRRLLLVEDEQEIARIFVRILQRAGYEVAAFERAAPAMDALTSSSFDVLMTDVVVPGGGIAGLIEAFRKSHPRAPVLVCSGHVEEDLVAHGIARGDVHFLRKPFSGPELTATLQELFADVGAAG